MSLWEWHEKAEEGDLIPALRDHHEPARRMAFFIGKHRVYPDHPAFRTQAVRAGGRLLWFFNSLGGWRDRFREGCTLASLVVTLSRKKTGWHPARRDTTPGFSIHQVLLSGGLPVPHDGRAQEDEELTVVIRD